MGKLDGRVILITGAARGQGEAEARRGVAQGAKVVLADLLVAQGEAVAAELGAATLFIPLDVRDESQWAQALEKAVDRFGRLDGLVNNAGIVLVRPLLETTLAVYGDVVAVNQTGGLSRHAGGRRTDHPGRRRSIVNISSVDGLAGCMNQVAYCASKHAAVGMTKAAALELAVRGIRVNVVAPGTINTLMSHRDPNSSSFDTQTFIKTRVPLARYAQPGDVAQLVSFLLSDESSYCTGAEFVIDGGLLASV
jgi:3alpha(or 20beta)-hydroxysteroid dehydrogenase